MQGIGLHDPSQYVPAPHLVPQAPQLPGSFTGLTHAPLQQDSPYPHAASQPRPPLELPLLELPDVLPPLELAEEPELPPPEPLPGLLEPEEPPLEEADEAPVPSVVPSADASSDAPSPKVEPPHAMPRTASPDKTAGPNSRRDVALTVGFRVALPRAHGEGRRSPSPAPASWLGACSCSHRGRRARDRR
jgi:hypothetical protein